MSAAKVSGGSREVCANESSSKPNWWCQKRRGNFDTSHCEWNPNSPSSVCKEKGYNKLDMPR